MTTKEFNFLLKGIRREENFRKLYRECYPMIMKFSNYIFPRKRLGKDISQDVFHYFFSHSNLPYVHNYRTWLFSLCRNMGIRYVRWDVPFDETACTAGFDPQYYSLEMEILLSHLTDDEKDIIILHYVLELPFDEISVIKNKSYYAVTKQHSRILQKLKKYVK